ncbi:polyphosphate kinase 1 [Prochlorothrix hollandica]|uniref:polyphosphate kinase 1 n=1 Tax=Prochlorothrix hollandica TaxID=1223 RepID=UPI003342CA92
MSIAKIASVKPNLDDPRYYFNRELSWLEFNRRVLKEALDPRTPLLERLKFLGIFSSNLDEFFMVRVAGLRQQVEAGVEKFTPDGRNPQMQLADIRSTLKPMVMEQHHHFDRVLRPELAEAGIHFLDYNQLNQEIKTYLQEYFEQHIFPVLTPLAVDPSHPFPYISNLSLNLAVIVRDEQDEIEHFARIKIPDMLPRFIKLPLDLQRKWGKKKVHWVGVPLEQIIAHNLESLFPGMSIQGWYAFRVTRNADLDVEEDEADDLMLAIEQELRKQRMSGSVVRLELAKDTAASVQSMLMRELNLTEQSIYTLEDTLGLHDLMGFLSLPLPELKDTPWSPKVPPRLRSSVDNLSSPQLNWEQNGDFLDQIRQGDLLVHHPYHSFTASVHRFVTQAAHDQAVLAIKMTLYRTSGDSPIICSLIEAAENGKQVVVLVELKARFDEANNINWARQLEQAGVHVVYGLTGLKTHTKTTLVVRQEEEGIRRYVHIGTGNYNPKTAGLYTDLGLFSCRDKLGADLTDLFNYLTGYSRQQSYRSLLVAPLNMRSRMLEMIRREITLVQQGEPGRIIAKMNALVDPELIQALYGASQAGVEIDLIIRGICCLRPGLKKISDKIRVISIIGRFLEHSRIFYFRNGGKNEIYIGSADWMPRNLNRRVEAIVPIEDPVLNQEMQDLLQLMLQDNRQAWELKSDGSYQRRQVQENEPERSSQVILMHHCDRRAPLPRIYLQPPAPDQP